MTDVCDGKARNTRAAKSAVSSADAVMICVILLVRYGTLRFWTRCAKRARDDNCRIFPVIDNATVT